MIFAGMSEFDELRSMDSTKMKGAPDDNPSPSGIPFFEDEKFPDDLLDIR